MKRRTPSQCAVCNHRELHVLDLALARGVSADETATPGARLVKSARAARAKLSPLVESLNATLETAAAFGAQLEAQTTAAYQPPTNPPYPMVLRHQEIRAMVRNMAQGDRMTLITEAHKAGDQDTLIAIASVQPYLSGVPTQVQAMVRGQLIEANAPEQAKALKGLQEQHDLATRFRETMLQSVADLIDFQKADELIATAQEDVATA